MQVKNKVEQDQQLIQKFEQEFNFLDKNKKLILVTGHRRENFGQGFLNICTALAQLAKKYPNVQIVYPVHLNPVVQQTAKKELDYHNRIHLIEPLDVIDFHNIAARSYMIMSDSGGVQEEAPSLGVPVLVLRDTTERPEGVAAGTLKLVGTDEEVIYANFKELLTSKEAYEKMSKACNPYGDGFASKIISDILEYDLCIKTVREVAVEC